MSTSPLRLVLLLFLPLYLTCAITHAGTARYSSVNDHVRITDESIAYDGDSFVMRGGSFWLPYTRTGAMAQIPPSDFVWTLTFAEAIEVPSAGFSTSIVIQFLENDKPYCFLGVELVKDEATSRLQLRMATTAWSDSASGAYRSGTFLPPGTRVKAIRLVRGMYEGLLVPRAFYQVEGSSDFIWNGSSPVLTAIRIPDGAGGNVRVDISDLEQSFQVNFTERTRIAELTFEGPEIPDVNNGEAEPKTPDVNHDGRVNAQDVQLVVNSVLGIPIKAWRRED